MTVITEDCPTGKVIQHIVDGCGDNHEWYERYMRSNAPRIQRDASCLIESIPQDSSVLDIGAIPPLLAGLLAHHGIRDITVVDPNVEPFREFFEANQLRFFKANLLSGFDVRFEEQFDVLCLNEVIEHLAGNMLQALENAIRCVRPGGNFFITAPNLRSVSGLTALLWYHSGLASKPHDTVRQQYERSTAKYGYFGHLREYTEKEVVNLVESFGLKHEKSFYQERYYAPSRLDRLARQVERFFPRYRLFGKYLFRKLQTPT